MQQIRAATFFLLAVSFHSDCLDLKFWKGLYYAVHTGVNRSLHATLSLRQFLAPT